MRAALLVVVFLLLPGCFSETGDPDAPTTTATTTTTPATVTGATPGGTPTPPTTPGEHPVEASLLDANERFAVDLLQLLNAETPGENLVVSPYSIATALQMLYGGADGSTRTAMMDALRLGAAAEDLDEQARALLTALTTSVPNVTVRIGNSFWIDRAYAPNVNDSFAKRIGSYYEGDLRIEDFQDPATVDAVNEWASERTEGAIPVVLEDLRPDDVFLLLNAVLFEGAWRVKFDPACTYDAEFHKDDGTTTQVDMMCLAADNSWSTRREMAMDARATTVRLPYGEEGQFAMYVILPAQGTSLDDLVAAWDGSVPERMEASAELHMPRASVRTTSLDLIPPLTDLGMGVAFSNQADFSNIGPALYVSRVIHDALLEIDENGTRAAAVTTIVGSIVSVPPPATRVVIDRPYLVAIRDDETGTLLFAAKVHDP